MSMMFNSNLWHGNHLLLLLHIILLLAECYI